MNKWINQSYKSPIIKSIQREPMPNQEVSSTIDDSLSHCNFPTYLAFEINWICSSKPTCSHHLVVPGSTLFKVDYIEFAGCSCAKMIVSVLLMMLWKLKSSHTSRKHCRDWRAYHKSINIKNNSKNTVTTSPIEIESINRSQIWKMKKMSRCLLASGTFVFFYGFLA